MGQLTGEMVKLKVAPGIYSDETDLGAMGRWKDCDLIRFKNNLAQIVIDEYSQDNVYQHAYESYYQRKLPGFDEFIAQLAQTVVTGAMNGADDTLEAIYRSFMASRPLPPARRYPRRLKLWAPA